MRDIESEPLLDGQRVFKGPKGIVKLLTEWGKE